MSKDIKKALEHCVDWDCGNCPNRDELGSGETVCRGRLLPEVLEYVSDLEVKLSESKKQCQQCKHLNKKIELNIKNKLMAENCELQKQLADKEQEVEALKAKLETAEYWNKKYDDCQQQLELTEKALKLAREYMFNVMCADDVPFESWFIECAKNDWKPS